MDLAGIEPASESLSTEASPITAASFHSLKPSGRQQPHGFGSFIIRPPGQSLAGVVSRDLDAGNRERGCNRADEQQLSRYCNLLSVVS